MNSIRFEVDSDFTPPRFSRTLDCAVDDLTITREATLASERILNDTFCMVGYRLYFRSAGVASAAGAILTALAASGRAVIRHGYRGPAQIRLGETDRWYLEFDTLPDCRDAWEAVCTPLRGQLAP